MLKYITIPCTNISVICPETDNLFFAFFEDFETRLPDSSLDISTNSAKNVISIHQNPSLGLDNQKQVKF